MDAGTGIVDAGNVDAGMDGWSVEGGIDGGRIGIVVGGNVDAGNVVEGTDMAEGERDEVLVLATADETLCMYEVVCVCVCDWEGGFVCM